jgi:hypothetical protein
LKNRPRFSPRRPAEVQHSRALDLFRDLSTFCISPPWLSVG